MNQGALGKIGYTASILLLGLCAVFAFMYGNFNLPIPKGGYGLCLPSPEMWQLIPLWSMVCSSLILVAISLLLIFLNKKVNLTRSTALTPAICFLISLIGFPWAFRTLGSGEIMAFVNMVCISMLLPKVNTKGAPDQVFLVASLLSFGSMINYGFIWMMPVYLVIIGLLRILGMKEICAFIFGMLSPYIIVIGLGIVPYTDLRLIPILSAVDWTSIPLTLWIALGFTILLTLIISMYNAVRLFSAKKHIRYYNAAFNVLGVAMVALMVADFSNILTYIPTLLLVEGVAVGHALAKAPPAAATVRMLFFLLCYVALFILDFRI